MNCLRESNKMEERKVHNLLNNSLSPPNGVLARNVRI